MIKKINRIAIVGAGFSGAVVEQILQHENILGTYRYLDMDVTIGEALDAADEFLRLAQNKQSIPTFFVKPV